MINIKNIAKGFVLLSFLAGAVFASPVSADNKSQNENGFLNARASLKADSLIKLENSVGVVLGSNNSIRVMGAKVTSVSGSQVNATASFGQSSLSFAVKADADTKLNGKSLGSAYASSLSGLKTGDKISFGGTIASSSSSSLVIEADHIVSQALYAGASAKIENKNNFKGEVSAVNASDNSFSLKLKNGQVVKVALASGAVVTLDGETKPLSSLEAGDEVKIAGTYSADAKVLTATKVSAESDDSDDDEEDEDEDEDKNDDERKDGKRGWFGKIQNWFWK